MKDTKDEFYGMRGGLTRKEQETIITGNAERDGWEIYTLDPVVIRKCKKLGFNIIKTHEYGFTFKVEFSQITMRRKQSRSMSDAQKRVLSERLKMCRNIGKK